MSFSEDNIYTNGSNYYVITTTGEYFNICVELGTFNNKIISNQDFKNMEALPFNKENMRFIIDIYDVNKQIIYDDDDFDINNYIIYKSKLIQINNWVKLLNFIADKI
jgi:hypothetical protein